MRGAWKDTGREKYGQSGNVWGKGAENALSHVENGRFYLSICFIYDFRYPILKQQAVIFLTIKFRSVRKKNSWICITLVKYAPQLAGGNLILGFQGGV